MNQYCFDISSDSSTVDEKELKNFIEKIYRKKKFKELAYEKDEPVPFFILYVKNENKVCIKMTSASKKIIEERIEKIHEKITKTDLKFSDEITLSKPYLYELEQCEWWNDECNQKTKQKWKTLEHQGPYFTHLLEPYKPHKAPIIYDGIEYVLEPEVEKIANFYARRIISEEGGNITDLWTKDALFNKNFWTDFKTFLTSQQKKIFKDFKKLDFSKIVKKLITLKESEKESTKKDKITKKAKLEEKKQIYGFATINGIKEPLGNYTIEPSSIFLGRGANVNRGKIKRDIEPEEVTINIGKKAVIPKPPKGHQWKQVINDDELSWIASWKDTISNDPKYIYFAAEGQIKGKSDLYKYEKARKINIFIDQIRDTYTKDIKSPNKTKKQLGSVLYLIDNHGIRVGNEKGEDETDTVGASTLRVEHVKIESGMLIFDFLGKDSIRYYKEIPITPDLHANFLQFIKNKKPTDQLFDLINSNDINNYLKAFDKDFSAKVFRTRLASTIIDNALKNATIKKNATEADKKKIFIDSNVQVAKILNHQRNVSAKAKEGVVKIKQELKDMKSELKDLSSDDKKYTKLKEKIKTKKSQIDTKENTLNVAINTSLANYIDPRIVVSWTKKNKLDIAKVYAKTLQRKFKWASDMTDSDWDYTETPLLPDMRKLQPIDGSEKTIVKTKKVIKKTDKPSDKKIVKKVIKKTVKPTVKKIVPVKEDSDEEVEEENASDVEESDKEVEIPVLKISNITIVPYSDKSIAVIGNTLEYKDILKDLGGKYNPNLTINGSKTAGWIFSKKKYEQVISALNLKEPAQLLTITNSKTWNDVMSEYKLTLQEQEQIISSARNPNINNILKKDIIEYTGIALTEARHGLKQIGEGLALRARDEIARDGKSLIYDKEFLIKYLACINNNSIKKYTNYSINEISNELAQKLTTNSVYTYMFLILQMKK